MARNLVMCLDGTAGQVRGPADSNCVRVYELLDLRDDAQQVAYYDPGVGTFSSPGAWTPLARALSRLGGLVYGAGLRENLGEAYSWLMRMWQPGDRIFVFGFSRGAFTARALVGMLRAIGIFRPGTENQLQYVISAYARRGGEKRIPWDELHRLSTLFAQKVDHKSTVEVDYLGIWDSVKAMGLAGRAPQWPYTRQLPNARRIRHAVSIDEHRRPFGEYVVERTDPALEEVWFAGVHSDVGGTFVDDSGLSTIALKWVLEGAVESGMLVRSTAVRNVFTTVTADSARAQVHRNGRLWNLLIPRHRVIPSGAHIHASVRARMEGNDAYRPTIPAEVTWVDDSWAVAPGSRAMAN